MKLMLEAHEWQRKEHEKKMALMDVGMEKMLGAFQKLEEFLDKGISAYEAMANS